uniref:Membrane lipoprotein n=1 Tax=Lotus japonicus TaxID=34305 RepID=I3T4Y0_LOTJA|nr:unknown [Lotus japonicus]
MASSKLRKACSFTTLLLCCLNFTLFILSAASFAPTILLKMPPTSFGMAFLMVSSISLLSSFIGFYSHLTHFCFLTHISLTLAPLTGQVLAMLALFTKEKASLTLLKSPRDPKEAKLLVRVECGALMAMCMLQMVVLVLSCAVHSCLVKDYEGLEAEKEASAKKRSRRVARVQEESMANASKIAEVKDKEFDEKMNSKYGKWVKTDFEP